ILFILDSGGWSPAPGSWTTLSRPSWTVFRVELVGAGVVRAVPGPRSDAVLTMLPPHEGSPSTSRPVGHFRPIAIATGQPHRSPSPRVAGRSAGIVLSSRVLKYESIWAFNSAFAVRKRG